MLESLARNVHISYSDSGQILNILEEYLDSYKWL